MINRWATLMYSIVEGGGRNFDRPHVERTIFRNLKISNVQNYKVLFFYLLLFEHSNFRFFFNFSTQLFDNFQNMIFFMLKFL